MPLSKNDLRDFSSLHRKSKRQELGLFMVEGKKNCLELVESNFEVVLYVLPTQIILILLMLFK